MEAAIPVLLGTAVQHALESTNPVHAKGAADGPSRNGTHQSPSPSFPCIDEARALPHVAGFPDLRVLRPAPTAARPPTPLPGFAGYRRASLPAAPQATGPRRLSRVPRTTIRTFNAQYAGGFLSARSWNQERFPWPSPLHRTGSAPSLPRPQTGGSLNDAYSGFTHVADRTVASAPLRTRPLDHARGHHYQGPRRLPGPDSHRQAILNLSLLRHVDLHFLMAPEQSRRTRSLRQSAGMTLVDLGTHHPAAVGGLKDALLDVPHDAAPCPGPRVSGASQVRLPRELTLSSSSLLVSRRRASSASSPPSSARRS